MFTQTHCRLFTVKNQTERALWRTLLLSDCTCLSCVWICVHTTFALKAFVCLSLMSTGWGLDAVGSHLCCCVLWFTLSNWWNLCVCVCVRVGACVCGLRCTGPSQHVWPCSCSRANFSPGCAYASVPLCLAYERWGERMREKWQPIFHFLYLSYYSHLYFLSFY